MTCTAAAMEPPSPEGATGLPSSSSSSSSASSPSSSSWSSPPTSTSSSSVVGRRRWPTVGRGGAGGARGLLSLGLLLLLLALLALAPPVAQAIQMDVAPSATRCIMDEYAPEEDSALKVRAVGRVQEGVRATVADPDGRGIWDSYLTAQMQEVPLPEDEFGLYKICVHNGGSAVQRVEVGLLDRDVKLSGKEASITKEHLRPLQLLFRRAELTVLGVSKELDNVRQREAALRETSETTDSRIQWFGIFSIVILLAVAAWQLVFLKQFFRSKKLL